jgi:hypothetical protein
MRGFAVAVNWVGNGLDLFFEVGSDTSFILAAKLQALHATLKVKTITAKHQNRYCQLRHRNASPIGCGAQKPKSMQDNRILSVQKQHAVHVLT